MLTFYVSLDPLEAARRIEREVIDGSVTGTLVDAHRVDFGGGKCALTLVFEKHYYRAGNRLTLTVALDNALGRTRVHAVSGGGGEGLFRFDWGASDSFESVVEDALRDCVIGRDDG